MSDPLKDAMSRAVDGIAPSPPNADALKKAAKRSQLRRRIVGGYLGLILAGWLGAWAVSTINNNPNNDEPDRQRVAAPTAWARPAVTAEVFLQGEPASISADGDDIWVGLQGGDLVRIDPSTNEVAQTIDVGSSIVEVAADEGLVWVAGTAEGTEPETIIGGPKADTIFEVNPNTNEVTVATKLTWPSTVRMAADDGWVFFLDKTDSGWGKVRRYDVGTGAVTDMGVSASSLAVGDGSLWLGGDYSPRQIDAATGELLNATASDPAGCLDCSPPPRAIAAGDGYVAYAPYGGKLKVFSDNSELLYETDIDVNFASLAIESGSLFVGLHNHRLGVLDLETGSIEHLAAEPGLGRPPPAGLPEGPQQMAVGAQSVWVINSNAQAVVRVSDLGPAPVASAEPSPDIYDDDFLYPEDSRSSPMTLPETKTYRDDELGFSVKYPSDWFRAKEAMTRLVNPREILTLGTISLDIEDEELGDCAPVEPKSRLGPEDALVFVLERQFSDSEPDSEDYPQRPAGFGLDDLRGPEAVECWGNDILRTSFQDSGRAILVYVAFGEQVGSGQRQEVSDILGSLRFDPIEQP